jgi:hypothetical protein
MRLIDRRANALQSLSARLLAFRRYLRIGPARLVANWAWSDAELANAANTEPGRTLYTEAEKVRKAFADANPGYTLALSPPRGLERQVELWVDNDSVKSAGPRLQRTVELALKNDNYPEKPDDAALRKFNSFLRVAPVTPEPTNAAPGTSDHGRGTAVDFVVMHGRQKIADAVKLQIESRWKADGWERALIEACRGTRLSGPLQSPYEPWHWVLGAES